MDLTRDGAARLDAQDPIARFRDRFVIADAGVVYLDGNSLGRLSTEVRARLHKFIDEEWGSGLIRGWADWIELPTRVGDLIGQEMLGAAPGQVVVADSTTVNLYKLACAAVDARPGRRTVITDNDNFPTDRYVLQGICDRSGLALRTIHSDINHGVSVRDVREAIAELSEDVALVCLSHVAYRSGAVADMAAITAAAHGAGALVLWDLSHSVASVPIHLDRNDVDFAAGCTYKYLNAGPGAPAFSYVNARLQSSVRQPIWGWFAQEDQFGMAAEYQPAHAITQQLIGTPQVLQTAGLEVSVRLLAEAGIEALHHKGQQLCDLVIALADDWLGPLGASVASPRDARRRGSHVVIEHPAAWQVTQALAARGVIPDFRTPDRVRIGPAPIYTRFVDVWDAMSAMREILSSGSWRDYPPQTTRVT